MSAPGAELGDRAALGGHRHAGGGRGDRAVVVVDRQQQRLEEHDLGERALDLQQGGAAEVELALGVADDVAVEAVAGQVLGEGVVGDALAQQVVDLLVAEAEVGEGREGAPDPGHDAVRAALGQAAGEQLEEHVAVGPARVEGGLDHRELVHVGEQ